VVEKNRTDFYNVPPKIARAERRQGHLRRLILGSIGRFRPPHGLQQEPNQLNR
jgi:hypothetical protein